MTIARVRFRERQPLLAGDLNDEQAYHLALRRRHNIGPHTWGIVYGLHLEVTGQQIAVEPGMAIDGYGRELLLAEPFILPISKFESQVGDSVVVSLHYHRRPHAPPQDGRWPCGPDQHTRWIEETRLCLTPVNIQAESKLDPHYPLGVPEPVLEAGATRDLPDDPERLWPVYLGLLKKQGGEYTVDPSLRPYVALAGETLRAASGRAQMTIGGPLGTGLRFAVTLADKSGALTDDRLVIDSAGRVTINGDTTLHSDLHTDDFPSSSQKTKKQSSSDDLDARVSNLKIADFQFTESDLLHPECFALTLLFDSDNVRLAALWSKLSDSLKKEIAQMRGRQERPSAEDMVRLALNALNYLVLFEGLDGDGLFNGLALRRETRRVKEYQANLESRHNSSNIADAGLRGELQLLKYLKNRLLLEDLFFDQIRVAEDCLPGVWGLGVRPLAELPKAARSWQMYRVDVPQKNGQKNGPTVKQLRFEIANPGKKGDPQRSQFTIGHYTPADSGQTEYFLPDLTVDAAGNVVVSKRIQVVGEVIEGPIAADLTDPRLAAQLVKQFGQGINAGLAEGGSLALEIPPLPAIATPNWSYPAALKNTGVTTVGPIGVYETILVDGQPHFPATKLLIMIPSLAPGANKDLAGSIISLSAKQRVEVTLTALGVGPTLTYVFATATAGTDIVSLPDGPE